jgi:tetratricopeptide (TPR) repeat protein
MCIRFVLGLLCFRIMLAAQIDYYTPDNIKKFADHLFDTRAYQEAVAEYQRLSFVLGQSVISDSILFKIALCYQMDAAFDDAMDYYRRIVQDHPGSILSDKAHYRVAWLLNQQRAFGHSNEYIRQSINKIKSSESIKRVEILEGVNYLHLFQWQQAQKRFSSFIREDDAQVKTLHRIAMEGAQLPYKSAALAGIFSTLIPGSGKVYIGRKMDGLYAFLLISILGYHTYRTFETQGMQSVKGWLYGSVTAVLYAGNIYGSVVAAKVHNHRLRSDHINKIEVSLLW